MKFLFLMFSLTLIVWSSKAQTDDLFSDDQLTISRVYAGLNSTTHFPTDSISSYSHVDFRLGIRSQLSLTRSVIVKAWGVAHLEKNEAMAGYNSFEVQWMPTKKWRVQAGLVATPTTVLRPNPATWQSQVETRTQATILPGRPGVKTSYQVTDRTSITYGIFDHEQHPAHHLRLSFFNWDLAGYWSAEGRDFMMLRYVSRGIESTTTYTVEEAVSSALFIGILEQTKVFADIQYQTNTSTVDFLQTGIRRHFESTASHFGGFFGLSHDWKSGTIYGQLFVYLK